MVPESLRWLLAKGKYAEAERLIKRLADFNGLQTALRTQPELATQALLECRNIGADNSGSKAGSLSNNNKKASDGKGRARGGQASIKDLFSSTVMLKRSVILFYIW